jgi:cardiolipin synthase
MKRFLTILLCALGVLLLGFVLCLLNNPAKDGLSHNHNPYGLQSDSSQVYLLPSSQAYKDSLLKHISQARESIYMEMYHLGGVHARELMDLMRQKALGGVKVEVLVDGWGTKDEDWDYEAIRADGVEISFWDEVKFPIVNHVLHRNHRKVVIIDGEWSFIGSTNIADYSFGKFEELPDSLPCFDMNVQFRAGAPQVSVIEKADDLLSTMTALIDQAQDSIRVIQPYIALPDPVQEALLNALQRGVDIQFLLGGWNDTPVYQLSDFGLFHKVLYPAGARLWVHPVGFHHTKALSVDGSILFLGSTNMTYRALRRNLEENVLVKDARLATEFDKYFAVYAKESVPFDDQYWAQLPRKERVEGVLANRFNYLIIE